METQSAWIQQQLQHIENKNLRYEHIMHVLREEIKAEHEREMRMLSAGT